MHHNALLCALVFAALSATTGQRITTIQLDGVQYFVSRMNPYSPELNYFLAYQYCRSLGLQLASFETKEKADSITQYLGNAGYNKYDFWTSGNKLGTDMMLWMSTGLPFNATFNYMRKSSDENSALQDVPSGSTSPQRTARESGDSGSASGCVALKAPHFDWDTDDCMSIKDFICEQTRCYYYNYGSIPVSSAQGKPITTSRPYTSSASTESSKYTNFGINDLINKLRSTKAPPSDKDGVDPIRPGSYYDEGQATNGPYDSFHPQLQDDPAAMVDHHANDENYGSTIEPAAVTTVAGLP